MCRKGTRYGYPACDIRHDTRQVEVNAGAVCKEAILGSTGVQRKRQLKHASRAVNLCMAAAAVVSVTDLKPGKLQAHEGKIVFQSHLQDHFRRQEQVNMTLKC